MFVRTSLTGVVTASLAASALVLSAGTAHAAVTVDPDDSPFTSATDVIGAGSDTSQNALFRLAGAYNATTPAKRLATYAATGGGDIVLPSATISRPNGSGAGKALLYGAGNNPDVDFARSSSALNAAEVSAGLQAFPFALDTLQMAVSGNVASHAPTALTPTQIVSIYDGSVTNWNQLGGTSGVIKPLIPQSGSGTRSFFISQLTAANSGSPVTLAASVAEVQEHDPAPIQNDADVVAPFSAGRAGLAGTALRLETGFSADRALYNVVRSAALADADIQAIFGETGFVCSDDARDEILAAGFRQLDRPENDGVCGVATQVATSNFETNDAAVAIATSTGLAATSASAGTLKLVATVAGSTTPTGTVEFVDSGSEAAFGSASLIGGVATLTMTDVPAGTYDVTAFYTPTAESAFTASQGTDTVTVAAPAPTKATSKLTETFKKSYKGTKKATGVVAVVLKGSTAKATGTIVVKEGKKAVGTGTLKKGKATITLTKKKLGKGTSKLVASWSGNTIATGSKLGFKVTFK